MVVLVGGAGAGGEVGWGARGFDGGGDGLVFFVAFVFFAGYDGLEFALCAGTRHAELLVRILDL